MHCYNCAKEFAEGFEKCPNCGATIKYSDIDGIKTATNLNSRAQMLASQGRYEEAIEAYLEALEQFPDYAVAHYNLGLAYQARKRYSEAIASYTRAIEMKPDFAAAYTGRGDSRLAMDEREAAVDDYSMAIELYPDYAMAYFKRSGVFDLMQKFEEALADLKSYLTYKPHDVRARKKMKALAATCSQPWEPGQDF